MMVPATTAVGDPALTVNLAAPAVDGARATVSGSASMSGPLGLDQVTGVHISVTSRRHPATTESCDGCGAALGTPQASFSFTTPDLGYNGPYDITVDVSGRKILDSLLNAAPVSTRATASFSVEVHPAPPADVTAVVDPDRSVTVTWSANTEPDLVGYQVQRRGSPTAGFQTVSPAVAQPTKDPKVHWTDSTTHAGGQFEYLVVAVRPDGEGAVSGRATAASTGVRVTLPGPPGTPVPAPTAGPGARAGAGGSGFVTAGPGGSFTTGSPAPLDLPSFLTAGAGGPPKGSVPGVTLPDGAFTASLPFGSRGGSDALSADSVEILGHSTSRRSLLVPVAAGLLMCVFALHLRRFNRQMAAAPVEP